MAISKKIQAFLLNDATERFMRYVRVWTTSDEKSTSHPSTQGQLELGKILSEELKDLGVIDVVHDKHGYVYGTIPASKGCEDVETIGLIAHLDTSPAVSGKDVKPTIRVKYDGKAIRYPHNSDVSLTTDDSKELNNYIGLDIITSGGDTLLGADDKAGIAEIMAACAAWNTFSELKHGPLTICFTPDEEIGRGTKKINKKRLPKVCYTLDGAEMGQLEIECFDAWGAIIKFKGLSVHPGYAKDLMINAIHVASRFLSEIPEEESPEHTEDREGFYHLSRLQGSEEEATAVLIIRDFIKENNEKRMEFLKSLKEIYEKKHQGLKIDLSFQHQYENMVLYLEKEQKTIDLAKEAITMTGLEVKLHSIRGGTDGAKLSAFGIPTPNIFTGGLLFHSRKEYIPTLALQKAAEVILNLSELWSTT